MADTRDAKFRAIGVLHSFDYPDTRERLLVFEEGTSAAEPDVRSFQ